MNTTEVPLEKTLKYILYARKSMESEEALTVLLNVKCKHLLPEGCEGTGYPQHQELREEILKLWKQNPNIDFAWRDITKKI